MADERPTTRSTPASATPTWKKLGLAPGRPLVLDGAPSTWALPERPTWLEEVASQGDATVCVAFFRSQAELDHRIDELTRQLRDGSLWLAWPRRAGGHDSDLGDVVVRDAALTRGLIDSKVAAIDANWSGLRFTRRTTP